MTRDASSQATFAVVAVAVGPTQLAEGKEVSEQKILQEKCKGPLDKLAA